MLHQFLNAELSMRCVSFSLSQPTCMLIENRQPLNFTWQPLCVWACNDYLTNWKAFNGNIFFFLIYLIESSFYQKIQLLKTKNKMLRASIFESWRSETSNSNSFFCYISRPILRILVFTGTSILFAKNMEIVNFLM